MPGLERVIIIIILILKGSAMPGLERVIIIITLILKWPAMPGLESERTVSVGRTAP